MKLITIFLALSLLFCLSCNDSTSQEGETTSEKAITESETQTETPASIAEAPPKPIIDYVPEGYVVLDSTLGDLNRDEFEDLVLVLKLEEEEAFYERTDSMPKRWVYLFTGTENGAMEFAVKSDGSMLCFDCGGMMGDPYVETVIKDGYFSLEFYGGASWRWSRIITFKYNGEDQDWFLHRDGEVTYHSSNPEEEETSMETVKDFGKIRFEDFEAEG